MLLYSKGRAIEHTCYPGGRGEESMLGIAVEHMSYTGGRAVEHVCYSGGRAEQSFTCSF